MRSVLITGGTTRLGKVIADHLRRDGWRVLTTSHRPEAGADILSDLAEPLGAARLYAAALRLLGGNPPDALVNNAALLTGEAKTLDLVNNQSATKLTLMMAGRETGRGAVVNILDAQVFAPATENDTPYLRSKQAILGETRRLAKLLAGTLTVNAVAPGPVLVPEGLHMSAGETLIDRPAPEDVARAVSFLLNAPATTGCILPVDGGQGLLLSTGEA